MEEKTFSIDEPQVVKFRNSNRIDLGAAVALNFFGRCFDWLRVARLENKKIRIAIDYDPNDGTITATFSKRD